MRSLSHDRVSRWLEACRNSRVAVEQQQSGSTRAVVVKHTASLCVEVNSYRSFHFLSSVSGQCACVTNHSEYRVREGTGSTSGKTGHARLIGAVDEERREITKNHSGVVFVSVCHPQRIRDILVVKELGR